MPTGQEIQNDQTWVEGQGYQVTLLDKDRAREDWYRPDGKKIPNLPVDPWNRAHYRAKGWTLKQPTPEEVIAWKKDNPAAWARMQSPKDTAGDEAAVSTLPPQLVRELSEVTGTPLPEPPRHMHVFRDAIGSPCLVLGCGRVRDLPRGTFKSKKRSKEASNGRNR